MDENQKFEKSYRQIMNSFRPLSESEFAPILEHLGIERPYILYVGGLEARENLLRMLQAYAKIADWSTRWKLLVVGARRFNRSPQIMTALQELDLAGLVKFTPYIPEQDLPAVYSSADLLVFPSLFEGFGFPVLEAMACSTPVITSCSSSLPEIAGNAALLVDPYDVQELTSAMHSLLSDPDLADRLRRRGLRHVQRFSWETTARHTLAVYQELMDGQQKNLR